MKLAVLHDRTFELTPAMLMRIVDAAPSYEIIYHPAATATVAHLADAEIVFGCPPPELLLHMPFLRWHHLPNSGIQPYTRPDIYAGTSFTLTNSRGVYGKVISEHVLAMVLALARCFPLYSAQRQTRLWQRDDFGCVWVEGSTMSVFGLGDIGSHTAQKLKALGAHIIGVRRSLLDKPAYVDELYDLRACRDIIPRSDFVICCLPPTAQTERLFSREIFALMKPSAYFINVSRGVLVDTNALVDALREGRIAGAALDVTDPEPLPPEHPLWSMDNVIITPHASCVCSDIQGRKLELFLQMLERYIGGRMLRNQVSFIHGY